MYQCMHQNVDLSSLQGNEVQRQKEALRLNQSAIHREEQNWAKAHFIGLKGDKVWELQ